LTRDFHENLGNINIVPQDIGRVLLNLYNNAFYAVGEKKKQQPDNYHPTVSVTTKMIKSKSDSYRIEITVTDNGNGIPQKVVDKIFQPFFTTKPTGQGTGLGLSLAYDIVKAHGGEIKVNAGKMREQNLLLRCQHRHGRFLPDRYREL
jgi:signal transduction histidine kinase